MLPNSQSPAATTRPLWHSKHILLATAALLALIAVPPLAIAQAGVTTEDAGPSSIKEVYSDWTVSCQQAQTKDGAQVTACQMSQELRDKKSNQMVLAFALPAKPADNGANAVIVAPFGLELSKGISLMLGDPNANNGQTTTAAAVQPKMPKVHAPFKTCLPSGCIANFNLDETMKNALRRGTNVVISMVSSDQNKEVNIGVSLKGFTAAERRLKTLATKYK